MAFFSIITVTLNAEKVVRKTVQSVLEQSFSDFEIIVKDGFSSDDTLSLIPEDQRIRVFQKKDSGIYDAMNQAAALAEGRYLCFLNAGDTLLDGDVLEKVYQEIQAKGDADIFYGDYVRAGVVIKQPNALSDFTLFRNQLNHQSMFFSSKLACDERSLYDTTYRILADYEATVSSFKAGKRFAHIPVTVDEYEGNGFSETEKGRKAYRRENRIIRKKYFGGKYYVYTAAVALTMPKIRGLITNDRAPAWIRKAYSSIRNRINEGK